MLNSMERLRDRLTAAVVHRGRGGQPPGELGQLLAAVDEIEARTIAFLELKE